MKIKKIIPYILVFLFSFLITPILVTSFIKYLNKKANEFILNFRPNTKQLEDGKYQGKFKVFRFISMSEVEFEITNGRVKYIEFKKMYHSPGSPYKENIETQIRQTQVLEVDAISGATRSSNFAKAAIKRAIKNKINN